MKPGRAALAAAGGRLATQPSKSILDASFLYVPAVHTSVADTWRRFGWRPTTDEERKARQARSAARAPKAACMRLVAAAPEEARVPGAGAWPHRDCLNRFPIFRDDASFGVESATS